MSSGLYITATQAGAGKSAIALGVMEMLFRKLEHVGFFRPIITKDPEDAWDLDIELMSSQFHLDRPYATMYGVAQNEADHLLSHGKKDELLEKIIEKYNDAREKCGFILCEGTDFVSSTTGVEFDINATIIQNLNCPVLLVADAHNKSMEEAATLTSMTLDSLGSKGCHILGTIINRVTPANHSGIIDHFKKTGLFPDQLIYAIPEEEILANPTIAEVAAALGAKVLIGSNQLYRHARCFTVAAMQLTNLLSRIDHGTLIITPGDRADVIVGCMAALSSDSIENVSGIILTGGLVPEGPVWDLIKGIPDAVPVLSVPENTFPTALAVEKIKGSISPYDDRKIIRTLALFEQHVDIERMMDKVITTDATIMTPKMFEYELIRKARMFKKRIVLPEGDEERILRAVETILRRGIADITLLGDEKKIQHKIRTLGLRMDGFEIINPGKSDLLETYAQVYCELRKHKGMTIENARDRVTDINYFGTMMVHMGDVDGMVSGSVHSTAATIIPSFEIIKAKKPQTPVSGLFFMCLPHKVLAYGDCAINPDPNAEQLAEIAITSAQTVKMFDIEPRVAMLSYSTGTSGKGKDVDKVREATKIVKQKCPDLLIEGPIQYDAAIEPDVAKTKMPDSPVAGRATVFIFPDLNTGNNTYKAVQRSSNAVAIGPTLQGLNKPVNDLSRGCLVTDIINTVAITAIQAAEQDIRTQDQ
ncbi:phosphate acetyltransferase [Desulfobacter hydrogenophilus]|uniref:Phosphate acetyltransferase n=1 Tax=Desulfobacter hydrogenophilus TaxID=2291 RepID=A0A328FGB7_9BACT|nr:phosphate acetyltransferase [Desulfobacter hydrogenophilus]NDY71964.1 phosphate acetyltransferase [Desulfobacter hydrogenophilus]QBH12344.1 phosphate acetyltransferase [Desulfobacter hydrogenophilus]RAM02055.1 phosphate acetyltransferase [Desulfobacter hydrogenophilus]